MTKYHELIPLFQKFIKFNQQGKRVKINGIKLQNGSIQNFKYTLQLLFEYSALINHKIVIPIISKSNKKEFRKAQTYWKKFYIGFTNFLYNDKQLFDNYVGLNIKILRTFFNWLNAFLDLQTGSAFKAFYVRNEQIQIITLSKQQLQFLIFDSIFSKSLSPALNRTKNIFNLGCMVGLRFSDLMNLKKIDVEVRDENTYLNIVSIKTGVHSIIKLPIQAIDILNKMKINGKYLLPRVSLFCFNRNLKKLGELAGWTHVVGKCRQRRGKDINCKTSKNSEYRFCDHLSSHAMRRTAITLLLTMGVPELLVRKFSGHSTNSKSFNRYVNLAQSYMDKETDSAFEKLFQI